MLARKTDGHHAAGIYKAWIGWRMCAIYNSRIGLKSTPKPVTGVAPTAERRAYTNVGDGMLFNKRIYALHFITW